MAEVARRLKLPKESVSYNFRSTIEKKGYVVQARPSRGALGLREIAAVVDIAEEHGENTVQLSGNMSGHWFLHSIYRTLPDGKYILDFNLPEEHYEEFPGLLKGMQEAGFVTKVHTTLRFSWRRYQPMRADLFDFKKGRWEFDWSQLSSGDGPEARRETPRQRFDAADLSVLRYFLMDASMSIKDIAKDLGVSSKTAYRHARHIEDARLIEWYRVNWMKTHVDRERGEPLAPHHKFAFMHVYVHGVTPEEQSTLSERMNLLPFLWCEGAGPDYLAEMGVPLEQMVETMTYLREVLAPVAKRSEYFMIDTSKAAVFAPDPGVYNDKTKDWVFDLDAQIANLAEQLKIIDGKKAP